MRHFTGLLISVLALSSYACSPGTSERKPDSAYLNQIGSQDPLDQLKVILETSSNKEDSKLAMQKYLTAQGYSPSEVNQVIEAFMSSPLKNTDGLTYLEKIAALKVEANTLKGTNVEGVPTLSTILSGVKNLSSASAANGSDFLGGISGFQGSLKSIEQAALKNDLSEVAIRSNAVNEAAKAKDPLTSAFLLNQLANASSLTDISTVAGLAGLMSTSEVLTLEVIQESFKNQALKAVIDELAQDYSKLVSSGYDVGDTSTAGSTAKSFETNISNIIKDPSKAVDIAASARSEYERAILSLDTTPPSAPQQLAVPEQLDSLAVIPLQIVQGSPVNDFKEFSYKVCADSSCAGCSVEEIRTASGSFNFGPAALGRKYKVCARSVDFAGNLSAFMESTDIKIVDLTPPLYELEDGDLPGQNPSRKTKSSIRLSPVALDAKSYSWSIVSLPSGGSATFSSMNSRTTNVTFTADGLYKIKSTATDEAGNKAYLTYDILFDHTAPVMPTFTAIVTSVPVTLSVTSDDSTATYAYASQNPSQPLSITEISPGVISVDAALDGVYTLVITARDEVLNESTRLVSFTKNSAAPSLTLSVPTHVSAASVASVAISGSCSAAAANPVNVTIETISDSVSCVAGSYSKSFDLSSLSDGSKSISVTQTNSSTNLQASQSQSLVKDTVSPIMSITSIDAINAANKANYPISGTCSENVSVLITVESVQSSTLSCTSGLFSTHLNLSALSDGSKTLTATGTDPSTNVGSASVALTKDVQAPSLNFTVAPSARSSSAAVVAALSSSDGAQSSRSTIVAGDTACLSNMTYSSDTPLASGINLSFLAQGAHTVCILGKDAAGNETSAANALRLVIDHDSLAPLVRITSTPSYINLANRSAFSVGGLCDEVSAVVTLTVSNTSNVVVASATANCDGDGFNSSIDLSSIVDGSYTLKSTLSDALSNEASYSKAVTADTTAPTLSISSASDLTSIAKNLSVSGLCSEDGALISGDVEGLSFSTTCSSGAFSKTVNIPFLADGSHVVSLTLRDLAQNLTTTTETFNVDATGPAVHFVGLPTLAVSSTALNLSVSTTEDAVAYRYALALGDQSCAPMTFSAPIPLATTTAETMTADGKWTVCVIGVDSVGNISPKAFADKKVITLDRAAPTLSFDEIVPINIGNKSAVTVGGLCSENGASVTITVGALTQSPVCAALKFTSVFDSTSLTEGTLTFTAKHKDEALNETIATKTVAKDTTAPTLTSNPLANVTLTNVNVNVSGSCSENGETVSANSGSEAVSAICTSGSYTLLMSGASFAQGLHSVTLKHKDLATNETSISVNFTKDVGVPTLTLTSPSFINSLNVASSQFSGTCSEEGESVSINASGVTASAFCTSQSYTFSLNLSSIADSTLSILATHANASGNTVTSSTTIVKDTVLPSLSFKTMPVIMSLNKTSYAVEGSCSEVGQSISLTVGSLSADSLICTGASFAITKDLSSVADGSVTMTISTSDVAGNPKTVSATVTKSTSAPTLTLSGAPSGVTKNPVYAVAVNSANGVSQYRTAFFKDSGTCSAQVFSSETSIATPISGSLPGDGAWTLCVKGSDQYGNLTSSTVSTVWNLDRIAPTYSINVLPVIKISNVAAYTMSGTCSENGLSVNLTVGSTSYAETCTSNLFSHVFNLSAQAEGSLTAKVSGSDAATNDAEISVQVLKDTVAPTLSFNAFPAVSSNNRSLYVISGLCSEDTALVSLGISGINKTANCASSSFSREFDLSGLAEGTHTVTAALSDASGNPTNISQNLTIDVTPPVLTASIPAYVNLSNQASLAVSGTCSESSIPVTVSSGASSASIGCSANTFSGTIDLSARPEGSLSVTFSQTDASGNVGSVTKTTIKDATAPNFALINHITITSANQNSYSLVVSCSENGKTVTASVGTVNGSGSCTSGSVSFSLNLSSLTDGAKSVSVSGSDDAGNSTTQSDSLTKVTTSPSVNLSSAPSTQTNINTYSISVSNAGGDATAYKFAVISGSAACTSGSFGGETSIATPLAGSVANDGAWKICVIGVDQYGNSAPSSSASSVSWTLDRVAPTLSISALAVINAANKTSYALSGSCSEEGRSVALTFGSLNASVNCTSLSYHKDFDLSTLAEGSVSVSVSMSDAATNSASASATVTKDTVLPTLSYTAPAVASGSNASSFTLAGLCSENTRSITFTAGQQVYTATCSSLSFSLTMNLSGFADGTVAVNGSLTDAAGNSFSAATTITKDVTPPTVTLSSAPSGFVKVNPYDITVSSSNGATNYMYALVSGPASCSGQTFGSSTILSTHISGTVSSDGLVTLCVIGIDQYGNTQDKSSAAVATWTLDRVAPVLTFNTFNPISSANMASYNVSGTCSETDRQVTVTLGAISGTTGCFSNTFSINLNFTTISDGSSTITASQSDVATNLGTVSSSITKDVVPPSFTLSTVGAVNSVNVASYAITGTCSENGRTVTVSSGAASGSYSCSSGSFSGNINLTSVGDGTIVLTTSGSDLGGNVTAINSAVIKDTSKPVVTLTSSTSGPIEYNPSFTVAIAFTEVVTGLSTSSFVISGGTITSLSGSGAAYTLTITPSIGLHTLTLSLPAGSATDSAGNPSIASATLSQQVQPDAANPVAGAGGTIFVSPMLTKANFNLTLATDDTASQSEITYKVVVASTSLLSTVVEIEAATAVWSGTQTAFNAYTAGGANVYFSVSALTPGNTYYVNAIATDLRGKKTAYNRTTFSMPIGTNKPSFLQITQGYFHSCGVTASGDLYCWGDNDASQMGQGAATGGSAGGQMTPIKVPLPGKVREAHAGNDFMCALLIDGRVFCWGRNSNGQAGVGNTNTPVVSPTEITTAYDGTSSTVLAGQFRARRLSVGSATVCAIGDIGTAYINVTLCWGENGYANAKLGLGEGAGVAAFGDSPNPRRVQTNSKYAEISVAETSVCAIVLGTRNVQCWGQGNYIGATLPSADQNAYDCDSAAGTVVPCARFPVDINPISGGSNVLRARQISANAQGYNALSLDGTVYSWGNDNGGTSGTNASTTGVYYLLSPTPIYTALLGSAKIVKITTGWNSRCAFVSDGTVACWGANSGGFLHPVTDSYVYAPTVITSLTANEFENIFVGGIGSNNNLCAIRHSNGTFQCRGGSQYQFGNGGLASSNPGVWTDSTQTPFGSSSTFAFKSMSQGYQTACGITTFGRLYCSGNNAYGQLGIGASGLLAGTSTISQSSSFVPVASSLSFRSVSVGVRMVCAVSSDYKLYCWGDRTGNGTAISGSSDANAAAPTLVSSTMRFSSVSVSGASGSVSDQACALSVDGGLYCFGDNTYGQIGLGTTTSALSPTLITATAGNSSFVATDITSYDVGTYHSCVASRGVLSCTGANDSNQLGDTTTVAQNKLVAVPSANVPVASRFFEEISLGERHGCALAQNRALYCWGADLSSGVASTQPTLYASGSYPFRIMASKAGRSTYMITPDSSVWGLGLNTSGQLADGSQLNKAAFTLASAAMIPAASPVRIFSASFGRLSVLTVGGTDTRLNLRTIGVNTDGAIGDGTFVSKTSFAAILTTGIE